MKPKKIPVRMCIACREGKPKKELIRLVRTPEGKVEIDLTGKASGRGAYICPSEACLEKAYKTKSLSRALDCPMTEEMMAEIRRVIARRALFG